MARGTLSPLIVFGALALIGAACDVRPLTAHELYGAGGIGGVGGAGVDGAAAPDVGGTDASGVDATPEAPAPDCAHACAANQFCNELTGTCAPNTGVGMLSGQVIDACSGRAMSVLVGIVRKQLCSYLGKGSYFFTDLPLGKLKLTASKDGYQSFGVTVDIALGGVIQDIRLERVGGCDAPEPALSACVCTGPTCLQ